MRRTFASLLVLLGAWILTVQAASYYVSLNGNNSNPGTLTQPWRTLAYATGASSGVGPGDTIYMRDGTYSDGVTYPAVSGTASAPITIVNYQNETVLLSPGGFRFENGKNYWKIRGVSILHSTSSGRSGRINGSPPENNTTGTPKSFRSRSKASPSWCPSSSGAAPAVALA